MVYRREHWNCKEECTALTAYVRIDGKWVRVGTYGSECKKFEAPDLQKEEQERLAKQRRDNIKLEMRRIRQENKERRKIIESELNANISFFKQQTSEYQSK